jgi:hypothetical protein
MKQIMLCCGWTDLSRLETLLQMRTQSMPVYHGLEYDFCFRYGKIATPSLLRNKLFYRFLTFP